MSNKCIGAPENQNPGTAFNPDTCQPGDEFVDINNPSQVLIIAIVDRQTGIIVSCDGQLFFLNQTTNLLLTGNKTKSFQPSPEAQKLLNQFYP